MTTGLVLAVVNLKPGTSKSTSAMFLCAAFDRMGQNPLLIDADKGRSAQRWTEDAAGDVPWVVTGMATSQLHTQGAAMIRDSRHGVTVIDCPQMEDHRNIVVSALRLATDVLVPCAPAMIELDRTLQVAEELNHVDQVREVPLRRWALLTRTNRRRRSKGGMDRTAADGLTKQKYTVFDHQIETSSTRYRDTWGELPPVDGTPYVDVAIDLATTAGLLNFGVEAS